VLIRKGPDKPPDAPSSYRPICILDTFGKLLERLLLQRLELTSTLTVDEGERGTNTVFGRA